MKNKYQQGLSLVELMVSMCISMMVLIGLFQFVVASQSNYRFQQQMAGIQENAQFAMLEINKRIENSGGVPTGCVEQFKVKNIIEDKTYNPIDQYGLNFQVTLVSESNDDTNKYFKKSHKGIDLISIHSISQDKGLVVNKRDADVLILNKQYSDVESNQFLFRDSLCSQLTSFYWESKNNNVDQIQIQDSEITNCSTSLFGKGSCNYGLTHEYEGNLDGSILYPISTDYLYIADSTELDKNNKHYPALFINDNEWVQGVESLKILMGVDNNNDSIVDQYIDSSVGINNARIMSVLIQLQIRSLEQIGNSNLTDLDGYVRKKFEYTLLMRNVL